MKTIKRFITFVLLLLLPGVLITMELSAQDTTGENASVVQNLNRIIEFYNQDQFDKALTLLDRVKQQIRRESVDPDDDITFLDVKHWHTQFTGEYIIWDLIFYRMGSTPLIGDDYLPPNMDLSEVRCNYFRAVFVNANNRNDLALLYFHRDDADAFQSLLANNIIRWRVVAQVLPSGNTKTIPILKVVRFNESPPEPEEDED
jgi:hypothetical protein